LAARPGTDTRATLWKGRQQNTHQRKRSIHMTNLLSNLVLAEGMFTWWQGVLLILLIILIIVNFQLRKRQQ